MGRIQFLLVFLPVAIVLHFSNANTSAIFATSVITPTVAVRFFVTKPEIGDAEQDAAK